MMTTLHFSNSFHAIRIPSSDHDGERFRREFQPADADHRLDAKDPKSKHPSSVKNSSLVMLKIYKTKIKNPIFLNFKVKFYVIFPGMKE